MSTKMVSKTLITAYLHQLECDEKASATIEKYRHDINLFYEFLPGEKILTKEDVIRYKQYLIGKGYAATSINSMLVAVNSFLSYIGAADCRVRLLKQQRRTFCEREKELTRDRCV